MELVEVEDRLPTLELYEALEEGNILLLRHAPWDLPRNDQAFLRGIHQTSRAYHKNIAYRPAVDKVTGVDAGSVTDGERLHAILRRFSQNAVAGMRALLPKYMEGCHIDYASFRVVEEEGRSLSWKKRNDLLHIDAFPTRPTGGDLILRAFVNINEARPRVWLTSDPFQSLARQYAVAAGWPAMARNQRLARWFTRRSAYDRFMLHFHDYLKGNREYQEKCRKYRWEFAPGATWIVFTDVVPHAVLSGQYALEQTVIVPRENLLSPARAPVEILKQIGSSLTSAPIR